MDQDLGVSLDSLVELVVGNLRVIDADLVRNHERWLGLARDDQVSEVSVVLLDVALTGSECETLADMSVTGSVLVQGRCILPFRTTCRS